MLARSLRGRQLAGDARAGSYARARARTEQYAYIRERWVWLVSAWILLVSAVPAVWWFMPSELLQGVLLGAVFTGASATLWFWVVQSTGTAPIMMGDQAEQWTAQSLRKLGREWRLVNRFVLSYGDMDHVAVGPAGALVFETKWSASPWQSDEGIRRQRDAVRQVERAARQLRLWQDVKASSVQVRSVVVLWGGATRHWPPDQHIRYVDGVPVVIGAALRDWVQALETDPAVGRDITERVWTALDAQARRRETSDPKAFEVPLSAGGVLARAFWFVGAATLSFLTVARVLSLTDSLLWAAMIGIALAALAVVARRRWEFVGVPAAGVVVGAGFMTLLITAAVALTAIW